MRVCVLENELSDFELKQFLDDFSISHSVLFFEGERCKCLYHTIVFDFKENCTLVQPSPPPGSFNITELYHHTKAPKTRGLYIKEGEVPFEVNIEAIYPGHVIDINNLAYRVHEHRFIKANPLYLLKKEMGKTKFHEFIIKVSELGFIHEALLQFQVK